MTLAGADKEEEGRKDGGREREIDGWREEELGKEGDVVTSKHSGATGCHSPVAIPLCVPPDQVCVLMDPLPRAEGRKGGGEGGGEGGRAGGRKGGREEGGGREG